jgi:hypothetical protein
LDEFCHRQSLKDTTTHPDNIIDLKTVRPKEEEITLEPPSTYDIDGNMTQYSRIFKSQVVPYTTTYLSLLKLASNTISTSTHTSTTAHSHKLSDSLFNTLQVFYTMQNIYGYVPLESFEYVANAMYRAGKHDLYEMWIESAKEKGMTFLEGEYKYMI